MTDNIDGKIEVGTDSISISGTAYEDLRPLIQCSVEVVSPLFHLVATLSSLSIGWIDRKLKRIGQRYEDKLSSIPMEQRQLPPLEIAASVIQNAAVSSDEAELHELFAELLASASDKERVNSAHPSFGKIIFELEPLDAKILRMFGKCGCGRSLYPNEIEKELEVYRSDQRLRVSIGNLVRQGLIAKETPNFENVLRSLRRASFDSALEDEVNAMTELISRMSRWADETIRSVYLTPFGIRFFKACIQSEPAVQDLSGSGE